MGINNFCGRSIYRTVVLLAAIGFTVWQLALVQTNAQSAQAAANPGNAATPSAAQKLEVGKPIERELKGGESHSYEITLAENQYLTAVVEQKGIDVAVQVMAPDGKQLMEVDSPNGTKGDEPVTFITEAAGVYRLNVKSPEKNVPVGKYEIRVKELRAATDNDHALQDATKLFNEAESLRMKGRYEQAMPLAERALASREKALGAEHPDTAESLSTLALLYGAKGDYAKAESLLVRASMIFEKVLGSDHTYVGQSLINLAALHRDKGDYAKAEPLFIRASTILEKSLGKDHPEVALSLGNLAMLYSNKGDYEKAEPLCLRTLAIFEKALGRDHIRVASSLNNLAVLYFKKGDYEKAEPLYIRASTITENSLGKDHPYAAFLLNNLAEVYRAKSDYVKAEPLYIRALASREKALGAEHSDTATSLNNLALLYRAKGDYAKAESLQIRALAIYEKVLGAEHPTTAISLNNLAGLYRAKGDYSKAIDFQSRCNDVSDRDLLRNLVSGSERQKLTYLNQTSAYTDFTISLHAQFAPNDRNAKRDAVKVLLQRKGRALDAMTDVFAALRRRLSPADQIFLNQLQDVRSQLSVLTLRGPGREGLEKRRANLKALEENEENLQNDISQRSAEFRAQSQTQSKSVTIEDIQKAIPQGTALVEFTQYRPSNPKETEKAKQLGKPRYVAYVLRNTGEPQWVELGDARRIDEAVDALRKSLRTPASSDADMRSIKEVQVVGESGKANVKQLARRLDELVMQPVRKLLGETRTVLLSPDGALNLIPFAALVDENKKYLVENYQFVYLTTGRDLLRLQAKLPSKGNPLLIGNPDYNNDAGQEANASTASITTVTPTAENRRSSGYATGSYQSLAGAEREVDELSRFLPGSQILKGTKATEAALKATISPAILHIATHGYFLPDQKQEIQLGLTGPDNSVVTIENPMLRSGLALAGANKQKSGTEDGVLTALEAAGLDLWGTKLVVLSACDTGVGDVKNGDGVYGLRRALVLAGSESQLMSLWPVSDAATRELMVAYYKGLQAGEGRAAALRRVQLQMLKDKSRQHPYYWASFIQSGEWANLGGKR
jgi:CHAT domain-containing protein